MVNMRFTETRNGQCNCRSAACTGESEAGAIPVTTTEDTGRPASV